MIEVGFKFDQSSVHHAHRIDMVWNPFFFFFFRQTKVVQLSLSPHLDRLSSGGVRYAVDHHQSNVTLTSVLVARRSGN